MYVTGIETVDSLFLGSATLEDAGYRSLSRKQEPSRAFLAALEKGELEPGLTHQMAVCLPFKYIYTHGDGGIIEKANALVNGEAGPMVVQLPEKEPDNIEYLPERRRMMVRETTPTYNEDYPKQLLIASVDREYNSLALDELLVECKKNNPGFQAYVLKNEPLGETIIKRHNIVSLAKTWEDYLDDPGFQEYYRERLARLFKEYRRWPRVPGFTGRDRELEALANAVDRFPFVQVDGKRGVGKSALLARMADKKSKDHKKIIWIHAETRFITRAEVVLSMALQMGLLRSPKILEEANLKEYIPKLEKEVEDQLRTLEALVVFDSLDPFLNQGWQPFEDKELQELLSRWVSEDGGLGKSRLVFTADLRVNERDKDFFKQLKTSFANAVRQKEQKIFLRPLDDAVRKKLFLEWLNAVPGDQGAQGSLAQANRLFKIGGDNLRLLRLLALWAGSEKDNAKLEEKIRQLEETGNRYIENLVYRFLFEVIGSQKQVILKTLEWIGKPVPRNVICSSGGMNDALEELTAEGLVIANKHANTIELVYRFGGGGHKKEDKAGKMDEKATAREIRAFRRMGDISRGDAERAMNFYSDGNSIVEVTGQWEEWADAPVINLTGLLAKAQYLYRLAKQPKISPAEKQALAERAVNLCKKCIDANIELEQSYFVCGQAMEILYPHSKEDEIKRYYKQSITFKPRADKYGRFAIFTYKRLKNFEYAETLFKKARQMETKNNYLNVMGLRAQAEFYLHWDGHEKEAGDVLNRIINSEKNELQNLFLAGRLFYKLNWKFLTQFFFEECLSLDKEYIRVLNSYAEAFVQWGDREKAIELFEKNLGIAPDHIQALNSYANACVQWGEKEKAIKFFEKALALDPNDVITLTIFANACVQWGEKDKAKQLFEKDLGIAPGHIQALNSYANACVHWGEKDKAIKFFEKALSLGPNDVITLKIYAKARATWGEKEKEQELLKKVKILSPMASPAAEPGKPKETETPILPEALITSAQKQKEPEPRREIKEPVRASAPMAAGTGTTAILNVSPPPGIKIPAPFSFTPQEKAWLISSTDTDKKQLWAGPKKWAGFGMLYTLYYLKGELNSTADLGWIPSFEREYRRLHDTIDDLYNLIRKAAHEPLQPVVQQGPHWQEEWFTRFTKEAKPLDLIAYYDSQALLYPQHPVCAAFLSQALEAHGWGNIAADFRQRIPHWFKSRQKEWQPFMTRGSVNLLTAAGKEQFLAFLKEQTPKQETLPTGVEPITEIAIAGIIDRFSVAWKKMPVHFPWGQLNPDEETRALGKLSALMEKLKNILNNIILNEENAFAALKTYVEEDLKMPVALMDRLDEYVDGLEKPAPLPWRISGEILEIKEDTLLVTIERSSQETQKREIPRQDFPEENPVEGQHFFAKIDPDNPDIVYDIEPLKFSKRTFNEIFISLFGKEIYDKVSTHWEKEDEYA
jgi:Tfp pilus assembly protein PilF